TRRKKSSGVVHETAPSDSMMIASSASARAARGALNAATIAAESKYLRTWNIARQSLTRGCRVRRARQLLGGLLHDNATVVLRSTWGDEGCASDSNLPNS